MSEVFLVTASEVHNIALDALFRDELKLAGLKDIPIFVYYNDNWIGVIINGLFVNVRGEVLRTFARGRPLKLEFKTGFDRLEIGSDVPVYAVRPIISQYGVDVPVYTFTYVEANVSKKVWQNIIAHVNTIDVDEEEKLGQIVQFLPALVQYKRDVIFKPDSVVTGDDFSCPLSCPKGQLPTGDCEDIAITTQALFKDLQKSGLFPLSNKYSAVLIDCEIRQGAIGMHMCALLVPTGIIDHWKGGTYYTGRDPILLLETTERTLTNTHSDYHKKYCKLIDTFKDYNSYLDISLLYPVEQFEKENFYFKFYSMYLPDGTHRHWVPFYKGAAGFTLSQLRYDWYNIRISQRFDEEDSVTAKKYVNEFMPPIRQLTGTEITPKGKGFPVYHRSSILKTAVFNCWKQKVEVYELKVCDQFPSVFVAYL